MRGSINGYSIIISSLNASLVKSFSLFWYQNQLFLRSEEYRQLFRLPQDEVSDYLCLFPCLAVAY